MVFWLTLRRANTGGPRGGLPYLHVSLAEKLEDLRVGRPYAAIGLLCS
jgi:hypothetical protein